MASSVVMRSRRSPSSSASLTRPPSPIPTGRGLRSAADQILSDYLDKSIQIPELTLPEEYVHRRLGQIPIPIPIPAPAPADIDYSSLFLSSSSSTRENDEPMIKRILRSAYQLGVFRIINGIAAEELRSTLSSWAAEADQWIFRNSDGRERSSCEELATWWHDRSHTEWAEKVTGSGADSEAYRTFRQKMDNVANKLETVAEQLSQIIAEVVNKQFLEENATQKSVLSIYRYNQHSLMDQDPPNLSPQKIYKSREYALSLHLIIEQCEFHVHSERGRFSFNSSPGTIVVTVGKQLEEWSHGKFKSAYGVLLFEPNLNKSQSTFSMELKYPLSNFNHSPCQKTVSIADQILIILIVIFVYKFFGLFVF